MNVKKCSITIKHYSFKSSILRVLIWLTGRNAFLCYLCCAVACIIISNKVFVIEFIHKYVEPIDILKSKLTGILITVVFILYIIRWMHKSWKKLYVGNATIFAIFTVLVIHVFYRSDVSLVYDKIFGMAYLDIWCFVIVAMLIEMIYNRYIFYKAKIISKDVYMTDRVHLLPDDPIKDTEQDKLDFKEHAEFIINKVFTSGFKKSFSIGVISPWGYGKTSFMNVMKDVIKKCYSNRSIIIDFNPRQSKDCECIQEDFFNEFCLKLSDYNNDVNPLISRYIRSLRISSKFSLMGTVEMHMRLMDTKKLKDFINISIERTKRIVFVFIDDFDRLTENEIIAVLKLIDRNASFKNTVFVTAFDDGYVNKTIGKAYAKNEYFIDKFFNMEYKIPVRPYTKYLNLLYGYILNAIDTSEDSLSIRTNLLKFFDNSIYLFESVLYNIRDMKRFYNQFINDYMPFKSEVKLQDFILLSLIKFRFYDEFVKLFHKEYITNDSYNPFEANSYFTLKQKYEENNEDSGKKDKPEIADVVCPQSIKILRRLFPKVGYTNFLDSYLSISSVSAFDSYFYTAIYKGIEQKEFIALSKLNDKLFYDKLYEWLNSGKSNYVIEYITSNPINSDGYAHFDSDESKVLYFLILTFYYSSILKTPDRDLTHYSFSITNKRSYKNYFDFNLKYEVYKQLLSIAVSGNKYYFPYRFVGFMLRSTITHEDNDYACIFSKEELQSINFEMLKRYLAQNKTMSVVHYFVFESCIENIELTNDTRKVTIMPGACDVFREFIENDPSFYLDNFIIDNSTANNGVELSCQSFCRQIFKIPNVLGSQDDFIKLVSSVNKGKKYDNLITLWKLYKANDYKVLTVINKHFTRLEDKITCVKEVQSKLNQFHVDLYDIVKNHSKIKESTISEIQKYMMDVFCFDKTKDDISKLIDVIRQQNLISE